MGGHVQVNNLTPTIRGDEQNLQRYMNLLYTRRKKVLTDNWKLHAFPFLTTNCSFIMAIDFYYNLGA
jgi:hypothetical protein